MAQPDLTITHVATGLTVNFTSYFLTEFQDTIDTQYNKVSTFGRMDPIVNYQGSQRKISIGFIVKNDNTDARSKMIHKKITKLQKMQYPVYEERENALTIQRPPVVLVKLANLIRSGGDTGLLCALEGFAFTPKTGFTPENSPLVRFGAPSAADAAAGQTTGIQTTGVTTSNKIYFQEYSFKFDLTVLHRSPVGFSDNRNTSVITDPDAKRYTDESGNQLENMRFLGGYYFGSHTDNTKEDVKILATTPDSSALSVQDLADVQDIFNTSFNS